MQAAKHRRAIGDVAHAQGYMFLAALLVEEAMHGEFAEGVGSLEAATNTTDTGNS